MVLAFALSIQPTEAQSGSAAVVNSFDLAKINMTKNIAFKKNATSSTLRNNVGNLT